MTILKEIISELLKNGQNITFAVVLILVLVGGGFAVYKLFMFMLGIIKEKDKDVKALTQEVTKFGISLDKIAGFLDILRQRSNQRGPM